jgi:hypothetical protein
VERQLPLISCRALGPIDVSIDGVPAPPELLWRKHVALLLYLLRSPRRTRGREHLIGLLWPDSAEGKARQSLNEALRIARHTCGGENVDTETADLVRLGDQFRLDVEEFEAAFSARRWAQAADLAVGSSPRIRGEGRHRPGGLARRGARHFRAKGVEALTQQAETLLARAPPTLRRCSPSGRSLDPLSERAARSVMRSRISRATGAAPPGMPP